MNWTGMPPGHPIPPAEWIETRKVILLCDRTTCEAPPLVVKETVSNPNRCRCGATLHRVKFWYKSTQPDLWLIPDPVTIQGLRKFAHVCLWVSRTDTRCSRTWNSVDKKIMCAWHNANMVIAIKPA